IAVADGDRVGSVQWPVHAALIDLDKASVTELVAGGTVPPVDLFQPTVGSRVSSGTLHGYLEAYGAELDALKVTFEVATDDGAPVIASVDVPAASVSSDRA